MILNNTIAVLVAVTLLAWYGWPWLSAAALSLTRAIQTRLPITNPPAVQDDDLADLAALKQVEDRFQRLGCNEGLAACQVLYAHFFHREAHP